MRIKRRIFRNCFTLVEVIVSMAVFSLLMLGLMQFFSSAQNLWSSASNRNVTYDEARTAMNLMAADLMCVYYEEGYANGVPQDYRHFLLVQNPADNSGTLAPALSGNRFKGIAFATLRSVKADSKATTRLTEVFYRKNGNVLETKTIADNQVSGVPPWVTTAKSDSPFEDFAHTPFADLSKTTPSDNWSPIASNVVRFYVKVLGVGESSPTSYENIFNKSKAIFPGLVSITLITVDEDTAKKLKAMNPSVSVLENYLASEDKVADLTTPEGRLLDEKMQTFTRTVYLDR